ncbi:hypothetical protein [Hyalangium versicolor]|uniref:hypothetical protein n=1 Tax=Hyalangium versicolor TaxID=2861190 RepID=UPI001CCC1291|nr:hypothetical protein [Hyalangium versicolor]
MQPRPPGPPRIPSLPYRKPQLGRDYWIQEQMLPNAMEVRERCLAKKHWDFGLPYRKETWPGMRAADALLPEELERVEAWVKEKTGATRLWAERTAEGTMLNHNCVQLVGEKDSGPRPHTDSLRLCRYAAVLYLTPDAPPEAGTSFYRLRLPGGGLSGNLCPPPHANLREALGITGLPLQAWSEDLSIPNVFNQFLLYRADLVHSATRYFGTEPQTRRMTAVFFWMAA